MTSEPKAPGAPAIILFHEVDRDDRGHTAHEDVYFRIKILTEEGRKYADIEIPFFKEEGQIVNIHARTIKPDGTIVEFNGKAFDKSIVKARGVKYMAKTFTLPDVQVGGILEYYYTMDLSGYTTSITRAGSSATSSSPSTQSSLSTLYVSDYRADLRALDLEQLPPGTTAPVEAPNHVVGLEASDIPAFQTEDYMPPGKRIEVARGLHL